MLTQSVCCVTFLEMPPDNSCAVRATVCSALIIQSRLLHGAHSFQMQLFWTLLLWQHYFHFIGIIHNVALISWKCTNLLFKTIWCCPETCVTKFKKPWSWNKPLQPLMLCAMFCKELTKVFGLFPFNDKSQVFKAFVNQVFTNISSVSVPEEHVKAWLSEYFCPGSSRFCPKH